MCLKKIFGGSKPETTWGYSNMILLTQAIDDYVGTENDLEQCLKDQLALMGALPEYQVRRYTNYQVKEKLFAERHYEILAEAVPGDVLISHYSGHGTQVACSISVEPDGYYEGLYLYDSVLSDKELKAIRDAIPEGVTVVFIIDSCFSGGMSKSIGNPTKARFVQTEDRVFTKRVSGITAGLKSEELNCIIMTACSENEVAYDGVFSPVLAAMRGRSVTYRDWFNNAAAYIKAHGGRQTPMLYGPANLLDKKML